MIARHIDSRVTREDGNSLGSLESKGRPGLGDAREESAFNMFKQMDLKGKTKDDTQLKTVHQNTISTIRVYEESGGVVRKFSSKCSRDYVQRYMLTGFGASGVDGRIVIWNA